VATQQYRRNIITSLKASDGTDIYNHENKASIIWASFKDRLGISEDAPMLMDLNNIIQTHELSHLDNPFTEEEIANVIKEMPIDKAPGPDGFNGKFLKKCWDLVKNDFMKLVNDFYDGNINLESINTAYITLIPKNNNPQTMNDYRPISLVSLPLKFITKLMANRLQKDIIPILHENQYGFIKGKNIQDSWDGLLNTFIYVIPQRNQLLY
jgi:hypothetical protein